ncbi:putative oxalocrotonate tautomerase [Macrophomina phaseolina]|uniref:Oxalocrotonate tautomerase n=1 Tax=Macrophomina phaseolina TaxID=35725 RepID=A0ABQ8FX25_9PEZI|nr:putative oxalocrotonate tautomerase [Macrophomina phaseolina]
MPFWAIYHSDSIFKDDTTRKPLAQAITKLHTEVIGLPAFYVVVVFIPLPRDGLYIGGEERERPFVRIVIDQIAAKLENDPEVYKGWTAQIDKMLEPHILAKGYDLEYHIDETEKMLWKLNGIYAPPFQSAEERKWREHNRIFYPEELQNSEGEKDTK